VRDIGGRVALEHTDPGKFGEFGDQLGGTRAAPRIAGDQDRVLGGKELVGELRHHRRIGAARRHGAELFARIAAHLVGVPGLRERLPLHHQVDRATRLALHDRVRAPQRLLDDDAGGQRPFPFHIRAHQAALVDRLLHEMHVGIAGADQFAARREWRLAGHQQHRDAAPEQVMHRGRGIGGADVDVHQHTLALSRHVGIAGRHMRRGVLVRAADDGRNGLAAFAPVRHLLDDRRVVGAEIAEQIVDADLGQPFEKEIRG
jgi:hypothetical protein